MSLNFMAVLVRPPANTRAQALCKPAVVVTPADRRRGACRRRPAAPGASGTSRGLFADRGGVGPRTQPAVAAVIDHVRQIAARRHHRRQSASFACSTTSPNPSRNSGRLGQHGRWRGRAAPARARSRRESSPRRPDPTRAACSRARHGDPGTPGASCNRQSRRPHVQRRRHRGCGAAHRVEQEVQSSLARK